MSLTTETKQLIQILQPKVSGFSQTFQMIGKHGDQITCGGEVKYVVDPTQWSEEEKIIFVTIDDAVGELLLVIPLVIWKEANISIGDILVANGMLFALKKEVVFQSKANTEIKIIRKDEPLRVLVKSIETIRKMD